jgi:hypothetical protein
MEYKSEEEMNEIYGRRRLKREKAHEKRKGGRSNPGCTWAVLLLLVTVLTILF